eukprot:7309035-Alexandrium_andersonii.AAC.1
MGSFGARSKKPSYLYSSHIEVALLGNGPLPDHLDSDGITNSWVNASGRSRVSGGRRLKETQ